MIKLKKSTLLVVWNARNILPIPHTQVASNKTQESEKQIQESLIGVKRVLDQGLNELQDKKKKTCNFFTERLSQVMDEQFSAHFKVTFQDRFEKNRNLAKKRKYEDKRK